MQKLFSNQTLVVKWANREIPGALSVELDRRLSAGMMGPFLLVVPTSEACHFLQQTFLRKYGAIADETPITGAFQALLIHHLLSQQPITRFQHRW